MPGIDPYVLFPGNAREALEFYAGVFGAEAKVHTNAEFDREGPAEGIAHGMLVGGPVQLFAADAAEGEAALESKGLMMALLGTADAATLTGWFEDLLDGGTVIDRLQERPWGASDGQVRDRYGVHWLVGFEPSGAPR